MTDKHSITCIIPFFNEGDRLYETINTISSLENISQIVCVDDGSTDGTSDKINKTSWPKVDLIKLQKNCGKAQAVKHGLKYVSNDLVLLLDADLQDINNEELTSAIDAMLNNPEIDMIILRRINAAWFVKMDGADILLSGERIMKRADLKEIFGRQEITGYQLEMAINTFMVENDKNVFWVPWSATNTYKTQKIGFIKGAIKEIKMFTDIFSYSGLGSFFKQFNQFTKNELEPAKVYKQHVANHRC